MDSSSRQGIHPYPRQYPDSSASGSHRSVDEERLDGDPLSGGAWIDEISDDGLSDSEDLEGHESHDEESFSEDLSHLSDHSTEEVDQEEDQLVFRALEFPNQAPRSPLAALSRTENPISAVSHIALTISDDRSVAGVVKERLLLALRSRDDISRAKNENSYLLELMVARQRRLTMMANKYREYEAAVPDSRLNNATESSRDLQTKGFHSSGALIDGSLIIKGLEPAIKSLTAKELSQVIRYLQSKADQAQGATTPQPSYRHQVFYRILRRAKSTDSKNTQNRLSDFFFDEPEWIGGQGSNATGLYRCSVPVENFDLFLEKNKDIAFLVLYTYVEPTREDLIDDLGRKRSRVPEHVINQSIKPVDPDLVRAIVAKLESHDEYIDTLQSFKSSTELLAPYYFCYHLRERLLEQSGEEAFARDQLNYFVKWVLKSQKAEYNAADALISRGKITHKHVGYLYKPGDVVVQREGDYLRGYVAASWLTYSHSSVMARTDWERGQLPSSTSLRNGLVSSRQDNDQVIVHVWELDTRCWDFDGKFSQRRKRLTFLILQDVEPDNPDIVASGNNTVDSAREIDIAALKVFPIRFLAPDIVACLRKRGETLWKCRERRYVSYVEENLSNSAQVEERYMVDFNTYNDLHKGKDYNYMPMREEDQLHDESMASDTCPEDPFPLLVPLKVKGYNLRLKKWFDIMVDGIVDVQWNKQAFSKVVMDSKAKDLIRALVSRQVASDKSTDLISGKGNGLILLLHGSPGTGKTLTAESVAEIAEKPLYRVTCGDVGTKAEDVEKYLESVFHLGKLWGCVVLLDEADVFLEQRTLADLERNALVSVFLRVLEYYEGILVLTSNRVGTFDEAFKSRIQLALHYPTLKQYQRLRIWENFLTRLEAVDDSSIDISDLKDHLDELSKPEMNGREIRNALTTARQYALWKETVLTYEQLKDVIEVSGRFDRYLEKLRGGLTENQLAEEEGIRAPE